MLLHIIRAGNESGTIRYRYDAGGKMAEQNDEGAGEVTRYAYDKAGRRVRMQSGNRDVSYRYGKNGELTRVTDNVQRLDVSYEYDVRGREIRRVYGNGVRQETIYDAIGRVILIRETDVRSQLLRAEGYVYDAEGRRSHSVDELGRITKYEYDSQSRLSAVLYPWTEEKAEADRKEASEAGLYFTPDRGVGERFTYSTAELVILRDLLNKAGPVRGNAVQSSQLVWRESYTYDRNGNRKTKSTPWGTIRYEYDAENRLIKKGDVVYTNDKDGNVLGEKGIRYEARYEYNGQNRMMYSEVTSHEERTHSVSSYGYDALGRRTTTQSVTGQTLRTVYDGKGFEVIREGETFLDGSLTTRFAAPNTMTANTNTLQSNQPTGERYRWISEGSTGRITSEDGYALTDARQGMRGVTLYGNGEAVAVSYASSTGSRSVYLGKDLLGSVRTATTDGGAIEDRYEYDAFGKPYTGDLDGAMNLGYTGKPYDTATGLYNYGYRDYSPQVARFTTVDPIRDGNNWFAYVNNDPVNWIDPWGLSPSDGIGDPTKLQIEETVGFQNVNHDWGLSASIGPPPSNIPGAGSEGWIFSPDSRNPRGGVWRPKPSTSGPQPSASWEPQSGNGVGHWDVDDGKGNRQRYLPDGTPITAPQAHGDEPLQNRTQTNSIIPNKNQNTNKPNPILWYGLGGILIIVFSWTGIFS